VTRLTVSGALSLPRATPPLRCGGRVRAQAKVGKRTVASSTVSLRARHGVCRYTLTLRPKTTRSARSVAVTAAFLGTPQLKPRSSRALKVSIR
jgi:hypothetical protein